MVRALPTLAVVVALSAASGAGACGFHNSGPLPSIVERMIAADSVVLARPDPENSFRYKAVEAVEGDSVSADIPFLVDSGTRRRLAGAPDDAVLFARNVIDGEWERLAYIGPDFRPILDQMVVQLDEWEAADGADRYAFFAELLNHPSPTVHRLALRELDQAKYGLLREVAVEIDTDRLLFWLDDLSETNLRSIRVLLLGLSGDPRAAQRIEQGLSSLSRTEDSLLGAYATAFLEVNGPQAAATLVDRYLEQTQGRSVAQELIVEALSLNSAYGDPEMRDAIAASIEDRITADPKIAATVARQFGSRQDWSFAEPINAALRSGKVSPRDVIVLSFYLAQANDPAAVRN